VPKPVGARWRADHSTTLGCRPCVWTTFCISPKLPFFASRESIANAVNLIAIKSGSLLGSLTYRHASLANCQKRLADRYALEPEIDLQGYTCRAVIDWISIRLRLQAETQHQWLQRIVAPFLGRKAHIDALDERPGGVSDHFELRIQEPDILAVRRICRAINEKYALQAQPIVDAIEISIDFTPKEPDDVARAKLLTVLVRHFQPSRDVMSNRLDRPRFTFGRGAGMTVGVLGHRTTAGDTDHFLISTAMDRQPYVDATYYVGAEDAGMRWRVMDKVLDRQNHEAGTRLELDDAKKRTRIEVTLDRSEITALGVNYLNDLAQFPFSRLQNRAFKFMLPSFHDPARLRASWRTAIKVSRDQERMQKFLNAGVIGVMAMDGALGHQVKALRKRSKGDFAERGLKLKLPPRVGKGSSGTFVAYEALNARIGVALRHLGERVATAFSVVDEEL